MEESHSIEVWDNYVKMLALISSLHMEINFNHQIIFHLVQLFQYFNWIKSICTDGDLSEENFPCINARSETVSQKFTSHIEKRRCLVIADGYFESNKSKQPFFFHNTKKDLVYLASFFNEQNEVVIITKKSWKIIFVNSP